jgi:aminopeptidase
LDPRIENLAKILVNYSIKVQPGDWVIIRADSGVLDATKAVMAEVLKAGGNPSILVNDIEFDETFLREANADQVKWQSPLEKEIHNNADAIIFLRGSSNTRALNGVDPTKQADWQKHAKSPFQRQRMQRTADGNLRWVIAMPPTNSYAQEADMSLRDYEDFVYGATFANHPDPVAKWNEIHDMQQKLIDWLVGKEHVEIRGPHVDLTLSVKDRVFINSDGVKNMPSGEIYTGPVEDSVNGWVHFTYPAVRQGREVEGVRLKFENGKVIDAKATKNEEYLLAQLDSDEGARYLGEFAIGTNYGINRFTKNILYDEKIGGTFHMAVGAGYPETGSKNRSAIHWDFICDMRVDSEIIVDGEVFYKNGQFQI